MLGIGPAGVCVRLLANFDGVALRRNRSGWISNPFGGAFAPEVRPQLSDSGPNCTPLARASKCRFCSLIPGFSVKLSAMVLAGPTQPHSPDAQSDEASRMTA